MLWRGGIVAIAGPLDENDLKDLDSYKYTTDRNGWLNENNNEMILMTKSQLRQLKLRGKKAKNWKSLRERDKEKI